MNIGRISFECTLRAEATNADVIDSDAGAKMVDFSLSLPLSLTLSPCFLLSVRLYFLGDSIVKHRLCARGVGGEYIHSFIEK